jgi:hypothetical protein
MHNALAQSGPQLGQYDGAPHTIMPRRPGQRGSSPGSNYVWAEWKRGLTWKERWRWVECPRWPRRPSFAGLDFAGAIATIRDYYDRLKRADATWWEHARILNPAVAFKTCPNYPADLYGEFAGQRQIVGELEKYLGRSIAFHYFRQKAWGMIMPGEVTFHASIFAEIHPKGGSSARQPAAHVAQRLLSRARALNQVLAEPYWNVISGEKKRWTFAKTFSLWTADLSIPDQDLPRRAKNGALLLQAYRGVPWPHEFFGSFLRAPRVAGPPFYGKARYNQPAIMAERVPGTVAEIQRSIAHYLVMNQETFERNFLAEVEVYIREQQKKIERAAERAERLQIATVLISALASALTGGLVAPVVMGIASQAFRAYTGKKLGKKAAERIGQVYALLNMNQASMDRLRDWIRARVRIAEPAPAPLPAPVSAAVPQPVAKTAPAAAAQPRIVYISTAPPAVPKKATAGKAVLVPALVVGGSLFLRMLRGVA